MKSMDIFMQIHRVFKGFYGDANTFASWSIAVAADAVHSPQPLKPCQSPFYFYPTLTVSEATEWYDGHVERTPVRGVIGIGSFCFFNDHNLGDEQGHS
jgi:hypothetical protein